MKFGRRVFLIAVAAASIAGGSLAGPALAKVAPTLAAALADPARADQQGDDARRKAAEVIAFSGVKPGWKVVDFMPGTGYWTRIFTGVVGVTGHVYAEWPLIAAKYATDNLPALQARGLVNVTAEVAPGNTILAPTPVDMVWTVQNYHDIPQDMIKDFNRSVFATLRKGGIYMVIDHADADFRGAADATTLHRIDPILVRNQVVSAGFQFVGESKVLRNPADDHSLKVFDPAIRGHTDQFVYKFRKP